jgi:hypothetical protein
LITTSLTLARRSKSSSNNNLKYVFDTISLESSLAICAAAISTTPEPKAQYTTLLSVEVPREDVDSGLTPAYTFKEETGIALLAQKIINSQSNL